MQAERQHNTELEFIYQNCVCACTHIHMCSPTHIHKLISELSHEQHQNKIVHLVSNNKTFTNALGNIITSLFPQQTNDLGYYMLTKL